LQQITLNKKHPLTRTVGVISLSRFLPRSCPHDRFVITCTATAHLFRLNLVYLDSILVRMKFCTATLLMLDKNCTWTAKTRAIPSLHRDSFLALPSTRDGVPGQLPDAASGNTPSRQAGSFAKIACKAIYSLCS